MLIAFDERIGPVTELGISKAPSRILYEKLPLSGAISTETRKS